MRDLLVHPAAAPVVAGIFVFAAFLAACFAQYGAIAPEALERHTPDDAYYFFQIGRNIAAGLGSCFSPGEPTNGYHPLWTWLIAALQWVVPMSRNAMVLVIVALGAVLAALSAAPLVSLLRTIGMDRRLAGFCGLIYVANPWMACLAASGMETGLFLLLFFSTFALFAKVLQSGRRSMRQALAFGVLSGLLMLCRTDSVFYVGTAMIVLAVRRDRSWPWILTAGSVATAIVAPWIVWSYVNFGTIEQSSSDAIGFIRRTQAGGDWGNRAQMGFDALRYTTFTAFVYPFVRFEQYGIPIRTAWGILLAVAVLAHALIRWRRRSRDVGWPAYLVVPAVALLVYFSFLRHFMQVWHISVLIAMCLVVAARYAWGLGPKVRWGVAVLLGLASLWATRAGFYAPQLGGIQWCRTVHPGPPRLVGHTDCGRFGYFSHHEVINLDGVVNNEILEYLHQGRLQDYVYRKGIELVHVDEPWRFELYNRAMTSERLETVPSPESVDARVRGHLDRMVLLSSGADERGQEVQLIGWVVLQGVDAAASQPLVMFLDADGKPFAAYRGSRSYRPDLLGPMNRFGVQYGGFELSTASGRVLGLARSVRLGLRVRWQGVERVTWSERVWPLAFEDR